MMDPRWLLRMSNWARNPPSMKRVIVVFAIIAAALAIGLIDWLGYWPDWATAERIPRRF
ncbi:hypothetical protein DSM14862_01386 [Sulfitobacter indolifex]|uniref:Lipoyl synthase n=1 Tax=Sulfitobacter indolifex HEL-45 TaxID=391624 RepID=A0ABM9X4W9_9RHOB|nr:hypothetical protein [Sulfitobacter indolifex]EDQ04520.1 hypothetical protein OIHEL45_12505 [Sulfitobacter indolifex HEL-45]UOA18614.1 hypothetical protein DSM14862_01386 [Sulfitobacter indolifex]